MKQGRPLVEGERRDMTIKLRVTPTMHSGIEARRGGLSRQDWIRQLIREALK